MSSRFSVTSTIVALLNKVSLLFLNPPHCLPAIGCPPTKVKPFFFASSNPVSQILLLIPQQSITSSSSENSPAFFFSQSHAASMVRHMKITSHEPMLSSVSSPSTAPESFANSNVDLFLLYPRTSQPAFLYAFASEPPISPSPTTPIFIIPLPYISEHSSSHTSSVYPRLLRRFSYSIYLCHQIIELLR